MLPVTINERTTAWLTLAFFDELGNAVAPSSATYSINCLTSGNNVLPSTVLGALATVMTIAITSAQNAMQNPANLQEFRRLTIAVTYGDGAETTAEYDYVVKNLNFIS